MFCDGKCKQEVETEDGKLVKECGLHRTVTLKKQMTDEIVEYDMCIFEAMLNSLHRLEDVNVVHLQTTQEQRNENVEQSFDISKTVAQGFLGVIYSVTDHENKAKIVKMLKSVDSRTLEKKELPDAEDRH